MSTFKTLATSTPYGDTDEVLHLYLDVESDAYVLKNVIKLVGSYTFSIWHRSEKENTITFNLFGNVEQVSSTTHWKKYIKTVKVSSLGNTNINISPTLNTNAYFYEGFLSEGTLDNSWTPAPEDVSDEIGSRIEQTANAINLRVSSAEGRIGTLEISSGEIGLEVKNARGDSSSLKARIDGIESKVVDENGQSIIEQTSQQIAMSVVENKFKDFKASARNLIRNSKTLLYNKYYLTVNGNSVFVDEHGTLITNSAIDTDDSGALIFVTPPTVDSDGVLII